MSDAFISLQNLTLSYGDTVAVPDLTLDIHKGELITLLGPSGCGKTTTMRAIAGLMQPASGRIMIDGTDVTRVGANKRQVGLVFQSYALFPHLSAFENVAFGLRLKRVASKELQQRVQDSLQRVGLAAFSERMPSELSGGQQQRLALARALVMEPKVLLLDEPLSNLDARLRLEMRTELQRLQRETGLTMVFVTHDQSEALALADRIVLMRDGRIAQIGTADDLYNRPATVFTADFVGFENIFRVARIGNNSITLDGDDGQLDIAGSCDSPYLAWRPGAVTVGSGALEGIVQGVAFAGEHREYVIASQAGLIKAVSPAADKSFSIGESVLFDLNVAMARQLSEE